MHRYDRLRADPELTDKDWKNVLAVTFRDEKLHLLLEAFRKSGNEPMLRTEAGKTLGLVSSDDFRSRHMSAFNQRFASLGIPVRMRWVDRKPGWNARPPNASIRLYKVPQDSE